MALTRGWGDVTRVAPGLTLSAGDTGVFALGREYHRVGRSGPQAPRAAAGMFARLFGRSEPDETAPASTVEWRAGMEVGAPADPLQGSSRSSAQMGHGS